MERLKSASLKNQMKQAGIPARFGKDSGTVPDRRERRRLDQQQGLVPFAVKLNGDLVKKLHAAAQERKVEMNELVGELLEKSLKAKGAKA